MSDRSAVLPQYVMPKLLLTRFGGRVASAQAGEFTTKLISWFIDRYQVNMAEALNPDPASYKSFNEFFTRELKKGARVAAKADYIRDRKSVV